MTEGVSVKDKLRRSLQAFSLASTLVVGVIVAFLAIYPMYGQLRQEADSHLQHALQTRKLAIEQALDKYRATALQITSRSRLRQMLEKYNEGDIDLQTLVSDSSPKLQDALNRSDFALGISRFDRLGHLVCQVGTPIPEQYQTLPIRTSAPPLISDPFHLDQRLSLVIAAPILDRQDVQVGTDIVLFDLTDLAKIIKDYTGLGVSGETLLGARKKESGVHLFFPLRGDIDTGITFISKEAAIGKTIAEATRLPAGRIDTLNDKELVFASTSVNNLEWGLAIKMSRKELYASINRQVIIIAITIAVFMAFGLQAVILLLRPLAGKIIIHTSKLEGQVKEKTDELRTANLSLQQEIEVRRRTEAQLQAAKETAEAATRAKSEFLASMSHEIRTPLNAVIGFSELLATMVTDAKQQSYLGSIKTSGNCLLTLINDILDLSKIEAGRLEIHPSPTDIRRLFSEMKRIFKVKGDDQEVNFIISVAQDIPLALMLDEARIRQILINLVGNAFKFTEKGHIKLEARRGVQRDASGQMELVISVKDTGIGIPASDQQRIFESFKQQDGQDTRKYAGTGLGLAICTKLAEVMGGKITLTSQEGRGSIFEVVLSSVEIAEDMLIESTDEAFDLEDVVFEENTVLVVDDIRSNRILLSELLDRANLTAITAADGLEALEKAEKELPALIIMDLKMPVMDGLAAVKMLKGDHLTRKIPVIAQTASSRSEQTEEVREAGFSGLLLKPIRPQDLYETLARFLPYAHATSKGEESPQGARPAPIFDEELERKTDLLATLEQEILPTAGSLVKAMVITDIEAFAQRLQDLGSEHHSQLLTEFGKTLTESVHIFDITTIERTLKELPDFVRGFR